MSTRRGDFFFTASGIQFWPMDPRPEEIRIEDIAYSLANTCRWGAQCRPFYSVAQHSVVVSEECPTGLALLGLMHDAAEAYIGDVKRPLKYQLPDLLAIEDRLWVAIAERFGLPANSLGHDLVKETDNRALLSERRELIHPNALRVPWAIDALNLTPLPRLMLPSWGSGYAEQRFLLRFHELTEGRQAA